MTKDELLYEFAAAYERHFQPGEYVYERTAGVIEHCDEHIEKLG